MGTYLGYRCSLCTRERAPEAVIYTCPACGGNLDVVLDFEGIRRATSPAAIEASTDRSLWRYLPLMPVADPAHYGTPLHAAGWTPLYHADRLGDALDLDPGQLFLKDEGRNPTASFKDRASAVIVARALELGTIETITTASSGNAAAALAGMAASVPIPTVIFVPHTAPQAKVAQLLIYGARVFLVEGTYDDAFDLTVQAAQAFGWYCRNTAYNPFTIEGKKTCAFEVAEQLTAIIGPPRAGRWSTPDWLVVSVGDGNIISGIHKGFKDLLALGWIERIPRLVGVQAAGSPAVYRAWAAGGEQIVACPAETLADSISVQLPRDGVRAVRAARETGGLHVLVSDDEILAAMRRLGRDAAVFVEPAAATGFAGLCHLTAAGQIKADETVAVVLTGNGLKDIPAALRAAGQPERVAPSLAALREALA